MLSRRQVTLAVTSAMSKYASENDGRRGLTKKDVITAVAEFGGDANDVRLVMAEGIRRVAPDHTIIFS